MKKFAVGLFCILLLCGACATRSGGGDDLPLIDAIERSADDITALLPAGTRIAIVAFEAEHGNIAEYIMDELTGAFVNSRIEVADRNNLEYVLKEQHLQLSGWTDEETAVSVGKFLAAKYIITGQMVNTGSGYRYRVNAVNTETAKLEANIRLNVRGDRALGTMFAALQKNTAVTHTAKYAVTENTKPATAGTWLDQGIMFASRGEWDKAIAAFTEAVTLDPNMAAAYVRRGTALIVSISSVDNRAGNGIVATSGLKSDVPKERIDDALADYNRAIRIDPNLAAAYSNRGNAYADKGDYDRAIADYTQAIRLDPNLAVAYNNRGNAYGYKGDYDRAIADCTQAIRLDPNYADAYNNRGVAYSGKGDYDRAIADYTQAIRIDSNYAGAYNNRGVEYKNKGDYDRAIADYTQAIRLDPNYANAYINRGLAYANKGDMDRAIADFTQAIRLDPNLAAAYGNRGVVYYYKGDYDRAIADLEAALRINPNDSNIRRNLEMLRLQRGY